ncbi:hypothetical protein A3D77_07535 [Candidatus Gottesmanbacteria bacterium RIFCSPHIGHO2_02_FULL_39_11]|uniref:YtkA-like domain-containing protein n=1 Tax=Candidatus Gottesmanbacteria bacterium RIFCSPHIGHO2_02_FULL_39_11 TaxID=1798382 RepID=A0A1F5ZSQ2_9BACT|nr:MAG: hypothetical protein A3D77_07535 [Candidatus Gottesmanbacteria bacterium RIFCSPHIGHO2_02_FULL_39_11]
MNNKNLLVVLAIAVGVLVILGFKLMNTSGSSSPSNNGRNAQVSLTTDPDPLKMGQATFIIDVKDQTGKPVDNATVFFDLNMTAMNMGTQQGNATSQGNGRYAASGRMSMRGPWKVTTKVTMPDSSVVNKDFTVNVP